MKLHECHGHIAVDGYGYAESAARHRAGETETLVRENLARCRAAGVAFYRDGGDIFGASALAKQLAGEYDIDYRTPAFALHRRGRYGAMYGRAFDSPRDFASLVTEAAAQGADFVKLMASGILDFETGGVTSAPLESEWLGKCIHIAHSEGFRVMVHVNGGDSIRRALEAGADSIEHGFYMDMAGVELLRQQGAVWVPTFAPVRRIIGCGKFNDSVLAQIIDAHGKTVCRAAAMGVAIACGSDAGALTVYQGAGAAWEQSWLTGLGVDTSAGGRLIAERFRRG